MQFFDDPGALAAAYEAGDLDAASGLPPDEATRLAVAPGSRLLRYPTSRLTVVVLNLRKSRPEFRDPKVRVALLEAIDRNTILKDAFGGGAVRADAPIPPSSWAFDRVASPALPFDQVASRKALLGAGWKSVTGGLARPGDKSPLAFDLLSPDVISNPATFAVARRIAADWRRLGLKVSQLGLPAADLVGQRLRTGGFAAAVVDVNVGLDPDLYPLLASTQTTSAGINFSGLQDQALDKLLVAARGPGTDQVRRAAYGVLQKALASGQYILPIAFRDELVVARDSLSGPVVRPIGDPADRFWDVLTWRLAVDR
jgi:ABC-type transport system substrate-binding protein